MEYSSSSDYIDCLQSSKAINLHVGLHLLLSVFYLFCAVLVSISVISSDLPNLSRILAPLLIFYGLVIFMLIRGGRGLYHYNHRARLFSFVGLLAAIFHQIYVIRHWDVSYSNSMILLYTILYIEIFLLFNLIASKKIRLLIKYYSKVQNDSN